MTGCGDAKERGGGALQWDLGLGGKSRSLTPVAKGRRPRVRE